MVKDHKVVKYIMEHVVHQVVKSSRSIRQSEWHNKELKWSILCDHGGFGQTPFVVQIC